MSDLTDRQTLNKTGEKPGGAAPLSLEAWRPVVEDPARKQNAPADNVAPRVTEPLFPPGSLKWNPPVEQPGITPPAAVPSETKITTSLETKTTPLSPIRIYPFKADMFGHELSYGLNPTMAGVMSPLVMASMHAARSTTEVSGFKAVVGHGGLIAPFGVAQGMLDMKVFSDTYGTGNRLSQVKYGAALLTDLGMMAPLANAFLSNKAPVLGRIAISSALARAALYLVPDEINEKK